MREVPEPNNLKWRDLSADEVYHVAHIENEARDDAAAMIRKGQLLGLEFEHKLEARKLLKRHNARITSWLDDKALARSEQLPEIRAAESAGIEIGQETCQEFCARVAQVAKTNLYADRGQAIEELGVDPLNLRESLDPTEHYQDSYNVDGHSVIVERFAYGGEDDDEMDEDWDVDMYSVHVISDELMDDRRNVTTHEYFDVNIEISSGSMVYVPQYRKETVIHDPDKGTVETGNKEQRQIYQEQRFAEAFDPDLAEELHHKAMEIVQEKANLKKAVGEYYFSNEKFDRVMGLLSQIDTE